MIKEVNIICVGDIRYRFDADEISHPENCDNVYILHFKDGSRIEFVKSNIICVEFNTKEAIKC